MKQFENKRICLVYHDLVYGAPQALFDFFHKNKYIIRKISFPLNCDSVQEIDVTDFDGNGLRSHKYSYSYTNFLSYALDLVKIIRFGWKFHHVFIGANPLNTLAGLVLKMLGRNQIVIFYSIDYSTVRFNSLLKNFIYKAVEKIAYKHADIVWNVSSRMIDARESKFGKKNSNHKNIIVPIGVWEQQLYNNTSLASKVNLVFIGHILEKQGLQLVLYALKKLLNKGYDFTFQIVGGGPYKDKLEQLTESLSLNKNVIFHGWVKDQLKVQSILRSSNLSVAMYDAKIDTFTYYADPTKLKEYLANGLPILMTDVPHNAHLIEQSGCGRIVRYEVDNLAQILESYMSNINLINESRQSAFEFSKKYIWDDIFREAIKHSNI